MSYEGYNQYICKNGHYYVRDAFDDETCRLCSAVPEWINYVDETNGPSQGAIPIADLDQFLITPEVTETCNLGHLHFKSPGIYRVPNKEETEPLRVYVND